MRCRTRYAVRPAARLHAPRLSAILSDAFTYLRRRRIWAVAMTVVAEFCISVSGKDSAIAAAADNPVDYVRIAHVYDSRMQRL